MTHCTACFIETPNVNEDGYCRVCAHDAEAFDLLVDEAKDRLREWTRVRRHDETVDLRDVATAAIDDLLKEGDA